MNWFCDNSILDMLNTLSEHNMESTALVQFIKALDWGNVVAKPITRTASSYATICCETDYDLSSEDYTCLEYATSVCEVQIDRQRYIVAINLDCTADNYYVPCAALVKILNHVRQGNCLFIFHLSYGIVFGSTRSWQRLNANDFCISCFIPDELKCYEIEPSLEAFLASLELADWNDIPQLIIESSPQEKIVPMADYDRERFNPEYIACLSEFSSIYGVDTHRQIDKYIHSFEEHPEATDITYKDATMLLARIGTDRSFSYDILAAADEASSSNPQLSLIESIETGAELSDAADRIIHQYSDEAFDNAELLLKEMMKWE